MLVFISYVGININMLVLISYAGININMNVLVLMSYQHQSLFIDFIWISLLFMFLLLYSPSGYIIQ